MPRSYSRAVRGAKKFFCNVPRALRSCGMASRHRRPVDAIAAAESRRERRGRGARHVAAHERRARRDRRRSAPAGRGGRDVRVDAGLVEDEVGAGRRRGSAAARRRGRQDTASSPMPSGSSTSQVNRRLADGKVLRRVQRQGQRRAVAGEDGGGAIALMDVEIDHGDPSRPVASSSRRAAATARSLKIQ